VAKTYLIDGYNAIFSTTLKEYSMERAREILIEWVRELVGEKGIVVFDGDEKVLHRRKKGVVFTKGESADEYIKRKVRDANDRDSLIVVTADKEIQSFVRGLGGKFLTPREFLRKRTKETEKGVLTEEKIRAINQELKKIWLKDKRG